MAYWTEDKIGIWEKEMFGKELTTEEYVSIAHDKPGMMLLLLHIWDTRKWRNDSKSIGNYKSYEEVYSKFRVTNTVKKKTEREKFEDNLDKEMLNEYNKGETNE